MICRDGAAGGLVAEPPLTPDGDDARSLLRRELLHPDYHQDNLVLRLLDWLSRLLDRGLAAARETPPLTTFAAMLVGLLLVAAVGVAGLPGPRARAGRRPSGAPCSPTSR